MKRWMKEDWIAVPLLAILVGICGFGIWKVAGATSYGPMIFMDDVSVGEWVAASNLWGRTTTGGEYTSGSYDLLYRVSATNRKGRLPVSTNVNVVFTGAATTNAVAISWPRYDGIQQMVVLRSDDAGSTWTWRTVGTSATTQYVDIGTSGWLATDFESLYSAIAVPTVPWISAGGETDPVVQGRENVFTASNEFQNHVTLGDGITDKIYVRGGQVGLYGETLIDADNTKNYLGNCAGTIGTYQPSIFMFSSNDVIGFKGSLIPYLSSTESLGADGRTMKEIWVDSSSIYMVEAGGATTNRISAEGGSLGISINGGSTTQVANADTAADGTSTNISDYNNDAGYVTAGSIVEADPLFTNTIDYVDWTNRNNLFVRGVDYSYVTGTWNTVIGGDGHAIDGHDTINNAIIGGSSARIGGGVNTGDDIRYNAILAGDGNSMVSIGNDIVNCVILGGENNAVTDYSSYSMIGGGIDNIMGPIVDYNSIIGGEGNQMAWCQYGAIVGGAYNFISNANHTVILGGDDNYVNVNGQSMLIGASDDATLFNTSGGTKYLIALGGLNSVVSNCVSSIVLGSNAYGTNDYTFVWSDSTNTSLGAVYGSNGRHTFNVRARGGTYLQGGGVHIDDALHLEPVSSPSVTNTGTIYYDSDDNKVKVWTGATWENLN